MHVYNIDVFKKRRNHNSDVHVYNKVALSNNLKMCNKTAIL